jgi:hypothetical protein
VGEVYYFCSCLEGLIGMGAVIDGLREAILFFFCYYSPTKIRASVYKVDILCSKRPDQGIFKLRGAKESIGAFYGY